MRSSFFNLLLIGWVLFTIAVDRQANRPIVRDWNERRVLPIQSLALVSNTEYPFLNFNPPLITRADGAQFVSVALIDSHNWIPLALNFFVSLAQFENVAGVTIFTVNNQKLSSIFRRLGFYVYDASSTVAQFPPEFRSDHPLPSWSWGHIIFLRFNLWFEAFRRGIGYCSLDLDVVLNENVLFGSENGVYADIKMQGHYEPAVSGIPRSGCLFEYFQRYPDRAGFYVNPGLSCHAFNDRTFALMQSLQHDINVSISQKMFGWGQPAYDHNFCEHGYVYELPNPSAEKFKWQGRLTHGNMTVSLFKAIAPGEHGEFSRAPAIHAKACHGSNSGDAAARVHCKEQWLKKIDRWLLPDNLPSTVQGWLDMDDATVLHLRSLLYGNGTTQNTR